MKIKICGLQEPENIKAVAALQPDLMGFICFDRSPRFIGDLNNDVLSGLSPYVQKTAVFVNESAENIQALIDKYGFDAVQLHGDESPEFSELFLDKVTVIKAFGLNEDFDFNQLEPFVGKVDCFLFDTKTAIHGGSGQTFNWDILDRYIFDVPFFLSGGISLENLEEVKQLHHPQFYGVDLNSRFETQPALKDIEKLKQAFALLKHTENEIRS
jgi:phosphoribosylanthranilate isomerase